MALGLSEPLPLWGSTSVPVWLNKKATTRACIDLTKLHHECVCNSALITISYKHYYGH